MSAAERYDRVEDPKPLSALPRPALAARIHVLREALSLLWAQVDADGAEPYRCIGSAKVELLRLEQDLRDRDAAERGAAVSEVARRIALAPFEVRLPMAARGEG